MRCVRFLLKVVSILSREKVGSDGKNNYYKGELANFRLNIMNKINCKKPVVMSYSLSTLVLTKIQPVCRNFI